MFDSLLGEDWGEGGYFKLLRGINNRGINTIVSYAEATRQESNPNSNQTESSSEAIRESILLTVILCAFNFVFKL